MLNEQGFLCNCCNWWCWSDEEGGVNEIEEQICSQCAEYGE